MKLFVFLVIITVIFLIYVEYTVGGIVFRVNASGNIIFNWIGAIDYLINPLYNAFLWNIKLLDVNYIFMTLISVIIYHNLNNYLR